MLDFVLPVIIGDGRAIILEHVIDVETEAVTGGRDARIDDGEAELIQYRGDARKAVAAQAPEDEHARGATNAARLERHEWLIGTHVALGEQPRVPCDFDRGMTQEI